MIQWRKPKPTLVGASVFKLSPLHNHWCCHVYDSLPYRNIISSSEPHGDIIPKLSDNTSLTIPGNMPNLTTPPAKSKGKPATCGGNPYKVRKSQTITKNRIKDIGTFINIATNYIDILLRNDNSLAGAPWLKKVIWKTSLFTRF